MLKIEKVEIYGWEAAIRGLRNPMNSWDKSDSEWDWIEDPSLINPNDLGMMFIVGENDWELAMKLAKAGPVHAKYRRMINVTLDIVAPLYWWKEFDTYKVGTVRNSCSTMHKIHAKEFELDDFSHEHLRDPYLSGLSDTIILLNLARDRYLKTGDKEYWWQMIQLLPSSYNQRSTIQLNYEVLAHMYNDRRAHKLDEWRAFCDWIKTLPYSELITGEE